MKSSTTLLLVCSYDCINRAQILVGQPLPTCCTTSTNMLDSPYQHVAQPLPTCCTAPTNMLHSPYQHVAQPLPTCCTAPTNMLHSPYQHVAQPLPTCCTAPTNMLHSPYQHVAQTLPTCCTASTNMLQYWGECVCTSLSLMVQYIYAYQVCSVAFVKIKLACRMLSGSNKLQN